VKFFDFDKVRIIEFDEENFDVLFKDKRMLLDNKTKVSKSNILVFWRSR